MSTSVFLKLESSGSWPLRWRYFNASSWRGKWLWFSFKFSRAKNCLFEIIKKYKNWCYIVKSFSMQSVSKNIVNTNWSKLMNWLNLVFASRFPNRIDRIKIVHFIKNAITTHYNEIVFSIDFKLFYFRDCNNDFRIPSSVC